MSQSDTPTPLHPVEPARCVHGKTVNEPCVHCACWPVPEENFIREEPESAAPPQVPSPQVSIAILRKHYLAGIECNHKSKTDRAMCACSRWNCPPQPSVGAAVERWLEHVQSAVIDEEFAGMATDEAYQEEARKLAGSEVSREPISAEQWLNQNFPTVVRDGKQTVVMHFDGNDDTFDYFVYRDLSGKTWEMTSILEAYARAATRSCEAKEEK